MNVAIYTKRFRNRWFNELKIVQPVLKSFVGDEDEAQNKI